MAKKSSILLVVMVKMTVAQEVEVAAAVTAAKIRSQTIQIHPQLTQTIRLVMAMVMKMYLLEVLRILTPDLKEILHHGTMWECGYSSQRCGYSLLH